MSNVIREALTRQHEIAWKLADFHLDRLDQREWLWRPATGGPHVTGSPQTGWRGDWPDREDYSVGPPSIAWLTWHIGYWWSMVLDHTFGAGTLRREDVVAPAQVEQTCRWIGTLERSWRSHLRGLDDSQLLSGELTQWPFRDRPFADVASWVTLELMKNAAEIGYARFLWAKRAASE